MLALLKEYSFNLSVPGDLRADSSLAWQLYGALLEKLPYEAAEAAHSGDMCPISQHVAVHKGKPVWQIGLLGDRACEVCSPALEELRSLSLRSRGNARIGIALESLCHTADVEELFSKAEGCEGTHILCFESPTAFKHRGQYVVLPDTRLITQNLIKQWNACVTQCPIEDTDGSGMETISEGLRISDFNLHSAGFYLKQQRIPGFTGTIEITNRLDGFHRKLADALLIFAQYSGIGIKTTLGMGGVYRTERTEAGGRK